MQRRAIRIEGDTAYVPLTKGYEAIINSNDVSLVIGRNWSAKVSRRSDGRIRTVYAVTASAPDQNGRRKVIRMHRVILACDENVLPDHRDGDGLNNKRANLRVATRAENSRNRGASVFSVSGVKGVSWHRRDKRWIAFIKMNGKQHYLGGFKCVTAAKVAYANASLKMHGEFSRHL